MTFRFDFDNSYSRLPERFSARLAPTPVKAPALIQVNRSLAADLDLDADALASDAGVAILAGNDVPPGAAPIALAYAGHQFGNFVPQLGDGRAILLGEHLSPLGRRDIQLKGSGPTPFSRGGDGRAAVGPVLREFLISEAMAAMGVPTTRTLAAVTTGEPVRRETLLPGAVLTRVAASHLRVGTFQYFAVRRDTDALRVLADYAIQRHYPEAATDSHPYRTFLSAVIGRQADLVAQWLLLGFIHGVMNTDNCSIAGETIDYGPCAFMDAYDPATVFSSIDVYGRYAYGNQPSIAHWNGARLAEAMLPILDPDETAALAAAEQSLATFAPRFEAAYRAGLRRKFGLGVEREGDTQLMHDLLTRMKAGNADFTLTFRGLCDAAIGPDHDEPVKVLFADPAAFAAWAPLWRDRLAQEPTDPTLRRTDMRKANPAVIPRNHVVEAVLTAAVERRDLRPFQDMLAAVTRPFNQPSDERYVLPPRPEERVLQTFCGT